MNEILHLHECEYECSVMQCVAVCCSVFCSMLQCVAVCCSVLQCAAVCCSVGADTHKTILPLLHRPTFLSCLLFLSFSIQIILVSPFFSSLLPLRGRRVLERGGLIRVVFECVAVCNSVLWCVAVCCGVLRCVAVCRGVLRSVAVCCDALTFGVCPLRSISFYCLLCMSFQHRLRAGD